MCRSKPARASKHTDARCAPVIDIAVPMSIDLNWETLTTGPDGLELAHRIRDFIHAKFQSVPLPRFIKSVTVHDFEFGSIPPELELKDITDPLPDFYEETPDADGDSDDEGDGDGDGDGYGS